MRLLILTFLIFTFTDIYAQEKFIFTVHGDSYQHLSHRKPSSIKDSLHAVAFLRKLQNKAISKGYILSSIDSVNITSKKGSAYLFLGPFYPTIHLQVSPKDLQLVKRQGRMKEKQVLQLPYNAKEIAVFLSSILKNSVNNGFPFAHASLDSVGYRAEKIYANLSIEQGSYHKWTKIHLKGDSSVSIQLISSLIGIKEGDTYNESQLLQISSNIRQVNYLQEIKPYEILFTEEGAELFLYIKSSPLSSINGVMGLQPNPITERLSVTGELNLKLLNVLRRGEQLQLNWRSITAGTQSFNAGINYPFLFKSPFGLDGKFQLYKRDTTFLETKTGIGVQYLLGKGSYIKGFYQLNTSSILSTSSTTPDLSTLKNSSYGFAFQKQQIDYLPNPTKGYIIHFESSIGTRKSNQADSLGSEKATTLRSAIALHYFIPLTKRNVIKLGGSFESYYAPRIYTNELYRFGGLTTLRGFNEDEIFASTKAIATIEYRFLTDKNSHVFVFYDQGIYENVASNYKKDTPFGFGAGFSFGTSLGIFSISYAQGKQLNNPILLRNGKIHFGYIAYF